MAQQQEVLPQALRRWGNQAKTIFQNKTFPHRNTQHKIGLFLSFDETFFLCLHFHTLHISIGTSSASTVFFKTSTSFLQKQRSKCQVIIRYFVADRSCIMHSWQTLGLIYYINVIFLLLGRWSGGHSGGQTEVGGCTQVKTLRFCSKHICTCKKNKQFKNFLCAGNLLWLTSPSWPRLLSRGLLEAPAVHNLNL